MTNLCRGCSPDGKCRDVCAKCCYCGRDLTEDTEDSDAKSKSTRERELLRNICLAATVANEAGFMEPLDDALTAIEEEFPGYLAQLDEESCQPKDD